MPKVSAKEANKLKVQKYLKDPEALRRLFEILDEPETKLPCPRVHAKIKDDYEQMAGWWKEWVNTLEESHGLCAELAPYDAEMGVPNEGK
jgi:hypothetical protein